jgi:hypothetical protein
MKGRISIGILFLMLICAGYVSAQKNGKPDFSGTWLLDRSKSKVSPFESKPASRAADPRRKESDLIIIEYLDPKFTAIEKQIIENFDDSGALIDKNEFVLSNLTYFTDGRGEKNTFQSNQFHSSETKQAGRKIIVTINVDEKKRKYSVFEFSLSKDEKELTIQNSGYEVHYDTTTRRDYFFAFPVTGKKTYRKI